MSYPHIWFSPILNAPFIRGRDQWINCYRLMSGDHQLLIALQQLSNLLVAVVVLRWMAGGTRVICGCGVWPKKDAFNHEEWAGKAIVQVGSVSFYCYHKEKELMRQTTIILMCSYVHPLLPSRRIGQEYCRGNMPDTICISKCRIDPMQIVWHFSQTQGKWFNFHPCAFRNPNSTTFYDNMTLTLLHVF